MRIVKCGYCGTEFESRNGRKYCSEECRANAANLRHQAYWRKYNALNRKECPVCGKVYWTKNARKRTCSAGCLRKLKARSRVSFDTVIKQADECGLSYGKYRAALNAGATYEELKSAYESRWKDDFGRIDEGARFV